jgi:hypothetical protein
MANSHLFLPLTVKPQAMYKSSSQEPISPASSNDDSAIWDDIFSKQDRGAELSLRSKTQKPEAIQFFDVSDRGMGEETLRRSIPSNADGPDDDEDEDDDDEEGEEEDAEHDDSEGSEVGAGDAQQTQEERAKSLYKLVKALGIEDHLSGSEDSEDSDESSAKCASCSGAPNDKGDVTHRVKNAEKFFLMLHALAEQARSSQKK